jgi:molybdopterin converting factor small subunit
MITIRITSPLRRFTEGKAQVEVPGTTVGQALASLASTYPALDGRVLSGDGQLREFVQVHLGRQDVRKLAGMATPVTAGSVLSISSPFSGG